MTIVTAHYRYKRPPKRRKAVALEVPAIVARAKKKRLRISALDKPAPPPPANDDDKPPPKPAAIVTVRRRKHAMHAHLLDGLTPEEVQRRGDAADALWRELVRREGRSHVETT